MDYKLPGLQTTGMGTRVSYSERLRAELQTLPQVSTEMGFSATGRI